MRYIATLAILLAPTCFAQDGTKTEISPTATPSSSWSGTYSLDLKNRYLGTMTGGVFADQTVAWQDLDVMRTFQNGTSMTITLWNSTGLTRSTWFKNFAYETDIDVNVSHKFGKYTVGGGGWFFLLYPGIGTHVLVADLKASRAFAKGNNTLEPFIGTAISYEQDANDARRNISDDRRHLCANDFASDHHSGSFP